MSGGNPYGMRSMGKNPYSKTNQFSQHAGPLFTPPQDSFSTNQMQFPNLRESSSHSWSGPSNPIVGGSAPPGIDVRYHSSLPSDFGQSHLQRSGQAEQIIHNSSEAHTSSSATEQNYQSSQPTGPVPVQGKYSNESDGDDGDNEDMDESDETTSDSDDGEDDEDDISSNDDLDLGIRKVRDEGSDNVFAYL